MPDPHAWQKIKVLNNIKHTVYKPIELPTQGFPKQDQTPVQRHRTLRLPGPLCPAARVMCGVNLYSLIRWQNMHPSSMVCWCFRWSRQRFSRSKKLPTELESLRLYFRPARMLWYLCIMCMYICVIECALYFHPHPGQNKAQPIKHFRSAKTNSYMLLIICPFISSLYINFGWDPHFGNINPKPLVLYTYTSQKPWFNSILTDSWAIDYHSTFLSYIISYFPKEKNIYTIWLFNIAMENHHF